MPNAEYNSCDSVAEPSKIKLVAFVVGVMVPLWTSHQLVVTVPFSC